MSIDNPHDLRAFFRQIGHFSGERALATSLHQRPAAEFETELLDRPEPVKVTSEPLIPAGFVDGIQAALLVTHRSHRPVYLNYAAAGCLSHDGKLVAMYEDLFASGAADDTEWFETLGTTLTWTGITITRPDEVAPEAVRILGTRRDTLEKALVEQLEAAGTSPIVVDGHLALRPASDSLLGVVKTMRTRYLPDETPLWGMPQGFMSARFRIPAGTMGCTRDRFSCYLRLHDASSRAWDFGLVRLEAFDPSLLAPLAAMALAERQSSRARDSRHDRHLAGVRAIEDVLRARRPAVFAM